MKKKDIRKIRKALKSWLNARDDNIYVEDMSLESLFSEEIRLTEEALAVLPEMEKP